MVTIVFTFCWTCIKAVGREMKTLFMVQLNFTLLAIEPML